MADLSASKCESTDCGQKGGFLCWRIWMTYAMLAAIGIPWYWPPDFDTQVLGLPAWTCVSLAASLTVSLLTTWLLLTHWPEETENISEEKSNLS